MVLGKTTVSEGFVVSGRLFDTLRIKSAAEEFQPELAASDVSHHRWQFNVPPTFSFLSSSTLRPFYTAFVIDFARYLKTMQRVRVYATGPWTTLLPEDLAEAGQPPLQYRCALPAANFAPRQFSLFEK